MKAQDSPKVLRGKGDTVQSIEDRSTSKCSIPFSEVLKSVSERENKKRNLLDLLGTDPAKSMAQIVAEFSSPAESSVKDVVPSNLDTKKLISLLVAEIRTEAPLRTGSSVDIEFTSKVLDGLHVRIERSSDRLDISFSTASATVSKLLTDNSPALVDALIQRGYAEPRIAIQEVPGTTLASPVGSSRERRGLKRDQRGQGNKQR